MLEKLGSWVVDSFPRFAAFVCLVVATMVALLVLGITHMTFPGERASIESLRSDLLKVGGQAVGEDVLGQATQWNQIIRERQAYNRTWWAGWAIPDGWNEIKPLPMPKEKGGRTE